MTLKPAPKLRLEVVPGRDLPSRLLSVYPPPNAVSVTCLPHHGPHRTVKASIELARLGYEVIPHLAARSLESRDELRKHLDLLGDAGVRELFLVAGDRAQPAGPYSWSGPLLEDVAHFSPAFSTGIAGYPEGHPDISTVQLRDARQVKAQYAASLVTQMCLSPKTVSRYLSTLRQEGTTLPVWIGVPGPITASKLLAMGARLGVGRSLKLARRSGLSRALLPGASLDTAALALRILDAVAADPVVAGIHVYTFNDLERLPGFLGDLRMSAPTRSGNPHSSLDNR